ncbi:hypothetical protein ARMSODRAFT_1016102 [Armillaria solidipes]|uniref:F-box domain-containing protein n=1 Tax=Armillaria solidipes TaxID=1076256 RepID=A0A2H3BT63_9AGAR|nr:hypothetical protein ARMSODRAFT_1016102 [Armillaria solidipes]
MQTRRSARTAAPFKRKSLTGPEPDEWQSEHNDNEGPGNDDQGRCEVSKHRSMKRIRTSSSMAATKEAKATQTKRKGTGKKRQTIGLFSTMPLDILFLIFGMLSPRDLINLSRVDASFCHTLTAHNVSFVWKAMREVERGIEPPRGVPEYRWIDLLFGKLICDFCRGKRGKKASVNWKLRRRLCARCLKANLISVSKVKIRFPDINDDVLSLIPFTAATSGKQGPREDHYWILDITDIQAKITELEAQPGSSKHLAEFRMERKTLVEDLNKHAERCEVWVHINARKKADDLQRLRDERFSMIKTRLLELGYNEQDVWDIRSEPSVVRDAELTLQGWSRICPGLEAAIEHSRVLQAKADRTLALYDRFYIVKSILQTYKQQFLPVVWREMPSFAEVCMFPAFRVILKAPTEQIVTVDSFADAVEELPTLIADWKRGRESELKYRSSASLDTGTVNPLKLATAVFFCEYKNDPIITNTNFWQHQCVPFDCSGLGNIRDVDDIFCSIRHGMHIFDRKRSAIAASLVQLASLDPATTTAEEMDNLNLRFLPTHEHVGEYSSVSGPMVYGLPILSWRECVRKGTSDSASPEPDFRLLMPEDESKKRRVVRKAVDFSWDVVVFHCQLCSAHVDYPRSYEDVIKHVQDVHGIDDPRMDRDLFLTSGADMPAAQRPPMFIVEFERDLIL